MWVKKMASTICKDKIILPGICIVTCWDTRCSGIQSRLFDAGAAVATPLQSSSAEQIAFTKVFDRCIFPADSAHPYEFMHCLLPTHSSLLNLRRSLKGGSKS